MKKQHRNCRLERKNRSLLVSLCGLLLLCLLTAQLQGCGVAAARKHSVTMNDLYQSQLSLTQGIGKIEEEVFEKERTEIKDDAPTQFLLELGALYSHQGKFELSNDLLEQAFWTYVEKEEGPVISFKKTGSTLAESTLMSGIGAYRMANYEKVYLHAIKARNYLLLGDVDGAGVEVRRAYAIQKVLREQTREELEALEEKKQEKLQKDNRFAQFMEKMDLDSINSQVQIDKGTREEMRRLASSYENPYAMTLSALAYLGMGEYNDAAIEIRRVREVSGSTHADKLNAIFEAPKQAVTADAPNVIVFAAVDHAPYKVSKDLRFFISVSKAMSKISLPVYVQRPATIAGFKANGTTLDVLVDLDLLAYKEYEERLPGEITKATMRFFAKTAKDAFLKERMGLMGQVLGSISNEFLEGADTRCWSAIPKRVYFGVLTVNGTEVDLQAMGTHGDMANRKEFTIDPTRVNVIHMFLSSCTSRSYQVAFGKPTRMPVASSFEVDQMGLALLPDGACLGEQNH